jgi:hypothetical protein
MDTYNVIRIFKGKLSTRYYNDKEEALEELNDIINDISILKEKYEDIVENFQDNNKTDDSPKYAVNMPRWTRDQLRFIHNELLTIERNIRIKGV